LNFKHAAAVAYEVDAPLSFEDIHVAPPGPSEVRVKMMYAAVCQSDLFYLKGKVLTIRFVPSFPASQVAFDLKECALRRPTF